jgi:hypothetical protein
MQEAETLRTIAEVAITIAGFTGVVVVFGNRVRGEWTQSEADRLWLLLAQALMASVFSFVPILLHSAGLASQAVWRVSNGTFAILFSAVGAQIAFRQRGLTRRDGAALRPSWLAYSTFTVSAFIAIAQLAYSAGIFQVPGSFLFLLGLLYVLSMAVLNFWQLLMGSVIVRKG